MFETISANSIPEAKYKAVKLIKTEGDIFTDQRGELIQEILNLGISIPAKRCKIPDDPLQALLGEDFAIALIDDDQAKLRGLGFVYGYGWELREENALNKTIELLKTEPNTRRAYIPMFKPRHVGQEDIPCFIGLDFKIRKDKLNLLAFSRSNENAIAMQNDIYGFSTLQKFIAEEVGCGLGEYNQIVASAHLRLNSEADEIDNILKRGYLL